jgi:signal transduction histidine kinase
MTQSLKQNPVKRFLGSLTGADDLRAEMRRLEAFLAAIPGEYCGFSSDGNVVYSAKFLDLMGLNQLENIHDIQNILNLSDAAILEGLFNRLQEEGKEFSVNVKSNNGAQNFNLSGNRGCALNGQEFFDILWLKDITEDKNKSSFYEKKNKEIEEKIKKFQHSLNALPTPAWVRGIDGNITWCNTAYTSTVESTFDEVIKMQKEISLKSKDTAIKSIKDLTKKVQKNNSQQKITGHIICGGKRHFVEITESPLQEFDNIFGIIHNLDREEELDTELQRHLSANKTLLEQLRSSIALFNANHELEFFNSSFSEFWGLEDQWLNSRPKLGDILEKLREMRRLPEQADFRNYKKTWLNMFTRLIDPHEEMMYLPDGAALRMLVVPHPMGGLMMIFEDVTSRLELESSYNTLIAVQKETLDNLAEGVAVYGGDGRLKLSNPSFAELWGLNPEDVEGEPHINTLVNKTSKFFSNEQWEEKKKIIISHGIERKVQEGRLSRNDSTLLEYATVPLPDGGVLVSYFDVTDSVKVENALREKNAALEAAEQLKTDFLANVSYQLRTPLNAIMGFAEILGNQYFGDLNDKQKEYSSGIQEAGGKLVKLIDDILDLSTIEAGYLELNMTEFGIHETLHDLHAITQEWGRKEKITVSLNCPKDIGSLIADESRIKQILLNLIHNAINFTPEKGAIKISVVRDKEFMKFTVKDNGIGISKSDLERVFEPFERAVIEHRADMSSASLSRGAGLGLSLVKNIVTLHGGTVDIDSVPDKGTTVTINIPLEPISEPYI